MAYYFIIDRTKQGPFSLEELQQKDINRDTMVWIDGYPDWMPAGDIPELAPLLSSRPPAFKTFGMDTKIEIAAKEKEKSENVTAFLWTLAILAVLIFIVWRWFIF